MRQEDSTSTELRLRQAFDAVMTMQVSSGPRRERHRFQHLRSTRFPHHPRLHREAEGLYATCQVELGVEPRFVDELRGQLDFSRSADGGFWRAVGLWQEFCLQRIKAVRTKANKQIQELLLPFINKAERTPSGQYMVNFDQLPDNIKGQVKAIQEENRDEELQLMGDPFLPFQLIVQVGTKWMRKQRQFRAPSPDQTVSRNVV